MTTRIPFALVDVFAPAPLTGNPLALVPDADAIGTEQMRAIAREFNQSETTFIVTPTRAGAAVQLRSFTPGGVEVLGAGHNAMGAWIWLADTGRLDVHLVEFAQQIGDEVLPVRVERRAGEQGIVTMRQSAPVFGATVTDHEALAGALGLDAGDLDDGVPAQVVSTGAGHLLVPVRDRAAVDRAAVDAARLIPLLEAAGGEGCYVYSRDPLAAAGGSVAYARFFNPIVGIAEDPATGTAAGPLVAALVARREVPEGVEAIVEQGYALGRPSRLRVTVHAGDVRLSGSGLIVAEGVLLL
jgi:PhzF family phenazine biosynthesis protein